MKFSPLQSLRDKLAAKGELAFDSVPLSAYGKLSVYKDYINLECHDGPAAEFKAWMDTAFGMTFEEFGGRNVTIEGAKRLLWVLPGGKHQAIAVLWPSADEGGLRKFPFAFFTVTPRTILSHVDFARGWRGLESVWRALEAQYERLDGVNNIEDFYARYQGAPVAAVQAEAVGEQVDDVSAWMSSLVPNRGAEAAARMTATLRGLIAAGREFASDGAELAVRVPLSSSHAVGSQLAIWEQVFTRNLKGCSPWPSLIVPSPSAEARDSACLVWREVRREDSLLFGAEMENYDFIEDVLASLGETESEDGAEPGDPIKEVDPWIAGLGGG